MERRDIAGMKCSAKRRRRGAWQHALSFHVVGFDVPAPVDPEPFKVTMRAILQKQAPTGRVCKPRKFDVQERVKHEMGAFDGPDAVDVELRFSPKVAPLILERPWHKRQEVKEHADGGITRKLRVTHSPELEGSVLRWAGDVEVTTPGRLRERMRVPGEEHARVHG